MQLRIMTRVQQMLLQRRKLKNLRNVRSVVLGTRLDTTHFRFTPLEVILKYEPNLEVRFKIEGKALINKIKMVYILQLYASKTGLAVCYTNILFRAPFGLGTQHRW